MSAARSPVQAVSLEQWVPPGEGGVRDHALALQRAWAEQGIASAVQVPVADGSSPVPVVSGGWLLVHYSGYGFHPRGLAGWLSGAVRRRIAASGQRVAVYFHETFAIGASPWRSAFWLRPSQERAARQVAALADRAFTNTSAHAHWLSLWLQRRGTPLRVAPVFSTIGECNAVPALAEREPVLAVFGHRATRQRALDRAGAHAGWLAALGVQRVVEFGQGGISAPPHWPLPQVYLGTLAPSAALAELARARWALVDVPQAMLGKSSVLAACATAGCLVLNTGEAADSGAGGHWVSGAGDGATPGSEYLALSDPCPALPTPAQAQRIAERLHRWYQPHGLHRQAHSIAAALGLRQPDVGGSFV